MKKIIAILAITLVLSISLVACNNNSDNENIENNNTNNQVTENNNTNNNNNTDNNNTDNNSVRIEPINTTFDMVESLDYVQTETGLNAETKVDNIKMKELYNFGEYEGLQKEARSKITEDSISEIAVVKIGSQEQTSSIFGILMKRRVDLQKEYQDNEKIMNILESGDCFVLKQQGGVVVSIIAENALEIDKKLDEQF